MKPIGTNVLFSLIVLGVFLVTMGVAGGSFWAFREITAAADQKKHTYTVINLANVLLSELKDAEIGQRGYALTGNEAFLEPYFLVRDNVNGHLNQLRQLDLTSEAQKHLDTLSPLVDAKLVQIAKTIDLRRHQNITAVIAAISNGDGKRLMDSIRAEMNGLIQLKETVLTQDEAKFQAKMLRLFISIVTATLFAFLFILWFAYLIYQKAQHRLKEEVQIVLSTSANPLDLTFCYASGANAYHVKPVDHAVHLQVLQQIFSYWLTRVVLPK